MKQLLSPRQFGQAIGVSESSIKRWCDIEKVQTVRTPGGHRRIPISSALQFLRQAGEQLLLDPEALGISSQVQNIAGVLDAEPLFREALLAGDEGTARQIVFELYLQRQPISRVGDDVVAAAMHRIGDLWECGSAEVFQERLACEICLNVFRDIRIALPAADATAPTALCATLEGDPYTVAVTLAELVLREKGWNAVASHQAVSFESLTSAIQHHSPRLICISASAVEDMSQFIRGVKSVRLVVDAAGSTLVLGGQAVTESIKRKLRGVTICRTLRELHELADVISGAEDGE